MSESRGELLAWVNDLLKLNLAKIEDLGKGFAHCQIIDSIYHDVALQKVKFDASQEFHYVANFKLLQQSFTRHKIDKVIPVDRLVKCRFQDNLEFLQWMKKYWEQHVSPEKDYDALARRGKGHVEKMNVPIERQERSTTPVTMPAPARKVNSVSSISSKASVPVKKPASTKPVRPTVATPQRSVSTHSFNSEPISEVEERPPVTDLERQAWVAREGQLISTCTALTEEVTQLRVAVDTMEKERDFYFNRLREIEIVVQEKMELIETNNEAIKKLTIPELLGTLQRVLYSSEEVVVPAVTFPSPSQAIEDSINISDETPPLIISSPILPPQGESPSKQPSAFLPHSPKMLKRSPRPSPKMSPIKSKSPSKISSPMMDNSKKELDKNVSLWTLDSQNSLPALPTGQLIKEASQDLEMVKAMLNDASDPRDVCDFSAGWTINGNASWITGGACPALRLVEQVEDVVGSAWIEVPNAKTSAWTVEFDVIADAVNYTLANPTNQAAYGFTFSFQKTSLTALGRGYEGLGFDAVNTAGQPAISVQVNIHAISSSVVTIKSLESISTVLCKTPTVEVASFGNYTESKILHMRMDYSGQTLTLYWVPTGRSFYGATPQLFCENIDIPFILSSSTGPTFAGFTASTGGANLVSSFTVYNYTFRSFQPAACPLASLGNVQTSKGYCLTSHVGEGWGINMEGTIGAIASYGESTVATPTLISSGASWAMFGRGGKNFQCGIRNNDTLVYCSGGNNYGQLGNSVSTRSSVFIPVQTTCGNCVKSIKVSTGESHACSLDQTGAVLCWGDNALGQVGQDPNIFATVNIPTLVNLGYKDVACGKDFTILLDQNNALTSFGSNSLGQLGDGTLNTSYIPVNITSFTTEMIVQLVAGGQSACARDSLFRVWCWGTNLNGQLTGTTQSVSIPTQILVVDGTTTYDTFSWVSIGEGHSCVVTLDRKVYCSGSNTMGQLGTGDTNPSTSYVAVTGLSSNISVVSCGGEHTCVLTLNGDLYCWGSNSHGQVGTGLTDANYLTPQKVVDPNTWLLDGSTPGSYEWVGTGVLNTFAIRLANITAPVSTTTTTSTISTTTESTTTESTTTESTTTESTTTESTTTESRTTKSTATESSTTESSTTRSSSTRSSTTQSSSTKSTSTLSSSKSTTTESSTTHSTSSKTTSSQSSKNTVSSSDSISTKSTEQSSSTTRSTTTSSSTSTSSVESSQTSTTTSSSKTFLVPLSVATSTSTTSKTTKSTSSKTTRTKSTTTSTSTKTRTTKTTKTTTQTTTSELIPLQTSTTELIQSTTTEEVITDVVTTTSEVVTTTDEVVPTTDPTIPDNTDVTPTETQANGNGGNGDVTDTLPTATDDANPTDQATDPTDQAADPTDQATDPTDQSTDPTDQATDPTDNAAEQPTDPTIPEQTDSAQPTAQVQGQKTSQKSTQKTVQKSTSQATSKTQAGIAAATTDLPFERTVSLSTDGGSLSCTAEGCSLSEEGGKFLIMCPEDATTCDAFQMILRDNLAKRQTTETCIDEQDGEIVTNACDDTDTTEQWKIDNFDGTAAQIVNAGADACLDVQNGKILSSSCDTAVQWKVSDVPFQISVPTSSTKTSRRSTTSMTTTRKLLLISQITTSTKTNGGYAGIAAVTPTEEYPNPAVNQTLEQISPSADTSSTVIPAVVAIVAGATVIAGVVFSASAGVAGVGGMVGTAIADGANAIGIATVNAGVVAPMNGNVGAMAVGNVGAAADAAAKTSWIKSLLSAPKVPTPAQSPHVLNQTPGFVDILVLCQSIVGLGLVDGISATFFTSFTENFWWSMGVFKWDWLISSATNMYTSEQNAYWGASFWSNSTSTIPGVTSVSRRAEVNGQPTSSLEVVAHMLGVPAQTLFGIVLIVFVSLLGIVLVSHAILYVSFFLADKYGKKNPSWVTPTLKILPNCTIGNMLRVWTLMYYPLALTSFFQLVLLQRGPVPWYLTTIAILILFGLLLALPIFLGVFVMKFKSNVPKLYEDKTTLVRIGSVYNTFDPYRIEAMMFFIPLIAQRLAAGAVTGAGYTQPWVQLTILLIADLVLLSFLIWLRPNYEPLRNLVYIFMSVFRLISVFLLIPTTPQFVISSTTRVALGWANIAIQGVVFASFILLIIRNITILSIRWGKRAHERYVTKRRLAKELANMQLDDTSSVHSSESRASAGTRHSEMQDNRSMLAPSQARATPMRSPSALSNAMSFLSNYYYPSPVLLPPGMEDASPYLGIAVPSHVTVNVEDSFLTVPSSPPRNNVNQSP